MNTEAEKKASDCEKAVSQMNARAVMFIVACQNNPKEIEEEFWIQPKEDIIRKIYVQGYAQGRTDEYDNAKQKMVTSPKLTESDLSAEAWREYDTGKRVYRIDNPVKLFMRPGGSTHRVLDSNGVVHCVIAPSAECILRWQNKEGFSPCQF